MSKGRRAFREGLACVVAGAAKIGSPISWLKPEGTVRWPEDCTCGADLDRLWTTGLVLEEDGKMSNIDRATRGI